MCARWCTANGGSILGEEYFPLDHADYRATVERIVSSGADVVFNMTVPPGFVPFFEQLHGVRFQPLAADSWSAPTSTRTC